MKNVSVMDKPKNKTEYAIEFITLALVFIVSAIVLYGITWLVSL